MLPAPAPETIEVRPGLLLLALHPGDVHSIFQAVDENREHLREWLPWVDNTKSPDDTRSFLDQVVQGRKEGRTLAWGVWESQRFAGVVGLHDIKLQDANLQVGYWLARHATGKGIMTACVRTLLDFAFLQLNVVRVEIRCGVGNAASASIPERLGFRLEGVARQSQFLNGRYIDHNVYSMLREEWLAGRA